MVCLCLSTLLQFALLVAAVANTGLTAAIKSTVSRQLGSLPAKGSWRGAIMILGIGALVLYNNTDAVATIVRALLLLVW